MGRREAGRPRGTVVARSDGKWLVRASLGTDAAGRRVRLNKIVHGTKAEAQRQLTALLKSADDGQPVALTRQTLEAWLAEWLETWCKDISERTRRDYANNVRRYLPRTLLARRLTALTGTDVQHLLNELTARGLEPRTVRYLHATLRRALNVAVKLGKITRNVATLADPPRQLRREMRALDPSAARAFLSAAEGTRYEAMWHLLLTTGHRPAAA
jgi:integrase